MFKHFKLKTDRFVFSLRFSILFIFISLYVITLTVVYSISKTTFNQMLLFTSYQFMEHYTNDVLNELTTAMKPAEIESQFSVDLIKNGVLNPNNINQMTEYTYFLVKRLPLIQVARWGDEQGNFIVSEQENDGTISSEIYNRRKQPATRLILKRNLQGDIINQTYVKDLSYDPRVRLWYSKAKAAKKNIWSDVYQYHRRPTLAIISASPAYNANGRFLGVFGLDIQLDHLSKFLENQFITPHGFSYLVKMDGTLIAMPGRLITPNNNVILQDISKAKLPWLTESLKQYRNSQQKKIMLKHDEDIYLFVYKKIPLLEQFQWVVGLVVPEKDYTIELEKMQRLKNLISLIPLILGLIILSGLVTRVVTPIKYLVRETEKIKHFDLDSHIHTNSRIQEVIDLTNAIKAMLRGLRSFQKYVPKMLVQQLIEAQEDSRVGGVRKSLVILFSDIKNFTAIAETIDPNLLMVQMCEYFDELTRILIESHGTIDKYIGDAIMAFWGAPFPENEPCHKAALAALLCQKKLTELNARWLSEGKPPLITRVAIHMGDAIIGNVGSSERLNYTAIGDTINMASRFENINKIYGTNIIVSDTVYHDIKDQFVLRPLDFVTVRGRKESNYIYELVAEKVEDVPYDINAYCKVFIKGFSSYRNHQFDTAIAAFEECLKIYPADTVAAIFIMRCEHFKLNPPPDDWYGVWKIEDK